MKQLGATIAAWALAGGFLLSAGEASACEGRSQARSQRAPAGGAAAKRAPVKDLAELMEQVDGMLAAKCGCESQADCTCKKGQCACAKCKKARQDVVEQLQGASETLKIDDARYDASAGVFI